MKTEKEILKKHTDEWFSNNQLSSSEDLPNEVIHAAMQEFAEQEAKAFADYLLGSVVDYHLDSNLMRVYENFKGKKEITTSQLYEQFKQRK